MTRRGFTLLEVMVAVTILGLGLTLILSSQAGMFASTKRIEAETYAVNLLRCKMGELEIYLEKNGYPLIDQNDSGDCCEDEDIPGYTCDWKIETVELPPADAFLNPEGEEEGQDGTGTGGSTSRLSSDAAKFTSQPVGAQGLIGAIAQGAETLPEGGGPEALASTLQQNTPGGPQGMVSMAMTLVYPNLKPMLEASIRKVTVAVKWQDGGKERDISVVQYVTNPLQGSLTPNIPTDPNDPLNQTGAGTGTGTGTSGPGSRPASPGSGFSIGSSP